ncbi:MAG TPA: hypothetical protein VFM97_09530 [Gammaproteobacteria bacterium]|nr:hypothetical protein [Gammaproteobacteria bacterium]
MNDNESKSAAPAADTTKPAAAAKPARTAKKPAKSATVVDTWFRARIHGSAIARHTACYNVLAGALDDLKSRLAQLEE